MEALLSLHSNFARASVQLMRRAFAAQGHYFLGQALRERNDMVNSIRHLTKALESARAKGDSIRDDIWRELAKAKYVPDPHIALPHRLALLQAGQLYMIS